MLPPSAASSGIPSAMGAAPADAAPEVDDPSQAVDPWRLRPADEAVLNALAEGGDFQFSAEARNALHRIQEPAMAYLRDFGAGSHTRLTEDDRRIVLSLLDATPVGLISLDARRTLDHARSQFANPESVGLPPSSDMRRAVRIAKATLVRGEASLQGGPRESLTPNARLSRWVNQSGSEAQAARRGLPHDSLIGAFLDPDHPRIELTDQHIGWLELPPARLIDERLRPRATTLTMHHVARGDPEAFRASAAALKVDILKLGHFPNGSPPIALRIPTVETLHIESVDTPFNWSWLDKAVMHMIGLREVITPPGEEAPDWMRQRWPSVQFTTAPIEGVPRLAHECKQMMTAQWGFATKEVDRWLAGIQTKPEAEQLLAFLVEMGGLIEELRSEGASLARYYWAESRGPALELLRTLTTNPDLIREVPAVLAETSGPCIDAHVNSLADLGLMAFFGSDAPVQVTVLNLLRVALHRHAEQLMAALYPDDPEVRERGIAMKTLVDLELRTLLKRDVPISTSPLFNGHAGSPTGVGVAVHPLNRWSKQMRGQAARVFHEEARAEFPGVYTLLKATEGIGKLAADSLSRDPATNTRIEQINSRFQTDHDTAQSAEPDNPHAGDALFKKKEADVLAARLALMEPLFNELRLALRSHRFGRCDIL